MSAAQTAGVAAPRAAVGRFGSSAGIRARGGVAPVRPLRRGASAWGVRPRAYHRHASVVIAGASRADDARESESDAPEADPTPALEFGRSAKRVPSGKPVLASTPVPAGILSRAGQVAVVAAAAMFGGAGVAQAAAIHERGAAGQIPSTTSVAAPAVDDIVGANDLGILLADADGETDEEAKARAKKLAEVRRLKAERKKQLQRRKKASDEANSASGADEARGDEGDVGPAAPRGAREKKGEDDGLSPAERKKAERIAKAKEKAFAEALERERAAAAAAAPEGEELELAEESVVAAVAAPEAPVETEPAPAKTKSKKTGKNGKGGKSGKGDGDAAKKAKVDTPPGEKGGFGTFLKKVTGPRFVRNINLGYLKDPFAVKGTTYFPCEVAYTGFYELCEVGRVTRVEYQPDMNSVKFYLRDTDEVFFANLPYDPTLYTLMLSKNIDIISKQYTPLELLVRSFFNVLTPLVLVYFAWVLWMEMTDDTEEGATLQSTGTNKTYNSQPATGLTMKDIAGIDVVREEMEELISYLKDFQKYVRAGATIPAGVLLCGPPGTGKTLLARCLAGEAGVPFFSCAGTEFMEMFVGVGAARIRNLFKQAREVKPCIIFIDEFDSVAVRRKDASSGDVTGNDEQVATINQLLTELDGFGGNSGVMVFAATNRPHVIDPALIRPGRFDRIVEMPLPNRSARCDIIDLHCAYEQYHGMIDPDLNVDFIARQAAGFTGADLENLVRTSALRNQSLGKRGVPAGDTVFLQVIDEIRRSNVFKATGSGTIGEADDVTENALIQQMNPYVRDTICTYYAAQTLVATMSPNFDDIAKVRVFAGGEENGQIVYVPDEVGVEGAAQVKRRAWYESKMAVLVAGQMAERYLYGPDKVSQWGVLDMREATAMACEMVMLHGWSDLGPMVVLQDQSQEEKYLKAGKQKGQNSMDAGRSRGKMWGSPEGKGDNLADRRKNKGQDQDATLFMLGISDELDLLIANEVRKIFVRACQRAVMIMHDPKGTEMLFTLREALATAKEINGLNLRAVFDKFGLERQKAFSVYDLEWGKEHELYWDEFVNHIWAEDPNSTGFWKLVQEQWESSVVKPTEGVINGEDASPDLPEWAKEYVRSLDPGAQEEMLMYAPKEVQERIRSGRPALYDGPGFGTIDVRTGKPIELKTEKDATRAEMRKKEGEK